MKKWYLPNSFFCRAIARGPKRQRKEVSIKERILTKFAFCRANQRLPRRQTKGKYEKKNTETCFLQDGGPKKEKVSTKEKQGKEKNAHYIVSRVIITYITY